MASFYKERSNFWTKCCLSSFQDAQTKKIAKLVKLAKLAT